MTTKPTDTVHPLRDPKSGDMLSYGLTKREHFAVQILAGLQANSSINGSSPNKQPAELAAMAVAGSDALIATLNQGT